MAILNFRGGTKPRSKDRTLGDALAHASIEVMPRTAAKIEAFRPLLPQGTRVYIAHIEGTPIDDMIDTAKRIRGEGFDVMPHFPARIIADRAELERWITRYRTEADVTQALVLAGGPTTPLGKFESAMELLDTGLFEANGYTRLHVAGHPEGNRDIDPDGGHTVVDQALAWKQDYANRSSAKIAIATQFAFEADGVLAWAQRLRDMGITLPIHLGIAGPAKLQTLLKFAIACGVGPSLSVLQKRAKDVSKLLMPYEPDVLLQDLMAAEGTLPSPLIEQLHIFPLGGIRASAEYVQRHLTPADTSASTGKEGRC